MTVKPAWRKPFLRNIRNGRTMTEAARLLRVGINKIIAERRKDTEFDKELIDLGYPKTVATL